MGRNSGAEREPERQFWERAQNLDHALDAPIERAAKIARDTAQSYADNEGHADPDQTNR